MASNVTYELSISDKKIISSLDRIIDKIKTVNSEFDGLQVGVRQADRTFARAFSTTADEADSLTGELKGVSSGLRDVTKEAGKTDKALDSVFDRDAGSFDVGNIVSSFNEIIAKGGELKQSLASGDASAVGQSISGLGSSLTSLLNPATLAIGGAAALGAGFVALGVDAVASAQELNKLKKEIAGLSGLSGEELNVVTASVSATSKAFEIEQEQLVKTINTIAKNRNLSFQEASKIVNTLVESGAGQEGLDRLNEYDIQFKSFGLTAKESVDLIRVALARGIPLDKLEDSVKEAGIKLREFSDSTKESLAPLGADFVKQFEKDRAEGTKTGLQLVQDVTKRAKQIGISAQETQNLVVGIFGTPGEDVGVNNIIDIFSNYEKILDDVNKKTEAQRKANQDLNESQRLVETEIAKLGDSFAGSGNKLTILKNNVIAFVLTGLNRVIDFISESKDAITDFFSPVTRFVGRFIDTLTVAYDATVGFFQGFLEGSGIIQDNIIPTFNLLKNVIGFVYDNILNFLDLILSIPSAIGNAFSFVTGVIDTVRAKIVEFAPALKPVLDALFFGFDQIRKVVSFVADAFDDASSAGQTMGKIFAYLSIPFKALIETISLAVTGTRVLGNSFKKLSNDFLGTKFDINPELSAETFTKELSQFKKKASNFFISPTVKPKLDAKGLEKQAKDAGKSVNKAFEEERDKIKGAPQAKAGGADAEKFEIKITADIKPFLDAVQKARDEIRSIGENEKVRIVQFQTAVDEITLRRSQESIERAKLESEQRVAQIQLATAQETALREAEIRRTGQLQALDVQRTEQLKSIAELESVALRNQKRAELEKAYQIEKKKIETNADLDRLNVENLNNQKRLELEREQQRQIALLQLRTIQDQQKRIEESLKAQRQKQFENIRAIVSDTQLFDQRRELEIAVTIANRGEIEKEVTAELTRVDASIAEFRSKIANANPRNQAENEQLQRDIQILRNLEQERLNTIITANQKIRDEEFRLIEAQKKISQDELNVRRERFDRNIQQAEAFVNKTNQAFDKIADLNEEFKSRINPANLSRNFDTSLLVINSFVNATRRSLGNFIGQFGDISRIKFDIQGLKESARSIDDQIGLLEQSISDYKKKLRELGDGAENEGLRKTVKEQLDALTAQRDALKAQRKTLVGDSEVLNERLDQIRANIERTQKALDSGFDPDTGDTLDENQKKRAQDSLDELRKQEDETERLLKQGNSNLDNALKERIKKIVNTTADIAEVVGNAVFDALKAGSQATISSPPLSRPLSVRLLFH